MEKILERSGNRKTDRRGTNNPNNPNRAMSSPNNNPSGRRKFTIANVGRHVTKCFGGI